MGLIVSVSVHPDMSDKDFSIVASNLMEAAPHIRNIGLAKDNVISHIFPLEGNESALGLRYVDVPSQKDAVLRAIETGKTVIAGPVDLVQGGKAFISRIPIFTGMARKQYWGIASVVLNSESLYKSSGLKSDSVSISFALRGKDALGENGDVFFGDASLFENNNSILLPINLPVGRWILAALPEDGWNQVSGLSVTFRVIGSLAALLIGLLVFTLFNSFKRIQYLALHDPLTGLSNRRLFDEHLKQCIVAAQRRKNKFSILYIDLDKFKPVNDEFGHKQGDKVLVAVSERIRACLRASDIIARMGGDEFIVILKDTPTPETASEVAEKIRRRISLPIGIAEENTVSVGASIGISTYPDNGESADELVKHADSAMYIAKSRII